MSPGSQSGEALEELGTALYLERDYAGAATVFERAYAAYRKQGNNLAAGRSARMVAWITGSIFDDWAVESGWFARAVTVLEEAGPDRPEYGWVLVIRSFSASDPQIRESLLQEAISVGRRCGDADVEFEALSYLGALYVLTDRVQEGLVMMDESLAAACAGEFADLCAVDSLMCGFFWACELVNDVPRADQWMRAAADLIRERNVVAAFCRAHYGGILTSAGRWDEAEIELTEAARHFDLGVSKRRSSVIIRLAELRLRQGRLDEAAQLLDGFERHPDALRTVAALHLARGETALARDLLERAAGTDSDHVPAAGEFPMAGPLLALLIDVCLAEDDMNGAERCMQRLGAIAAGQRGPYLRGAASLARGQVGLARGDGDARAHLHEAMTWFAEAQLPLDVARARLELARALVERAPAVAVVEARAALDEFERLSAARHADVAAALLRSLGAPVRTGPKGVGTLTKRELEVLRLLGTGLSNQEIGERLFITRKTVEHHVSNLLAKLGLRNRAEAAAYATREALGVAGQKPAAD